MKCIHPIEAHKIPNIPKELADKIKYIECGKCINCQKKKSYNTYIKIANQLKLWQGDKHFITLTMENHHYNPRIKPINYIWSKNIKPLEKEPMKFNIDKTIRYIQHNTSKTKPYKLIKLYLKKPIPNIYQLYLAKVKRHYDLKSKDYGYICLAEYGETTQRAHCHIILLTPTGTIKDLKPEIQGHYKSEILTKLWNRGIVDIEISDQAQSKYLANHKTFITKLKWQSQSKNLGNIWYNHLKNKKWIDYNNWNIINKQEGENAKTIPAPQYIRNKLKQQFAQGLLETKPKPKKQEKTEIQAMTQAQLHIKKQQHKTREKIRKKINEGKLNHLM